ncbi:hypothetical protein AGMMS50230_10830 [Spirochaetia bacterium]|nr:hypothetical protein AGMMS50230_10830 [Spirochaetia bacterium]
MKKKSIVAGIALGLALFVVSCGGGSGGTVDPFESMLNTLNPAVPNSTVLTPFGIANLTGLLSAGYRGYEYDAGKLTMIWTGRAMADYTTLKNYFNDNTRLSGVSAGPDTDIGDRIACVLSYGGKTCTILLAKTAVSTGSLTMPAGTIMIGFL